MSQFAITVIILAFCAAGSAQPVAPVPVGRINGPTLVPAEEFTFQPYEFGYELGDGLGMTQQRREIADGTGAVRGSYGYTDALGVSRIVEYKADRDGYKAVIRTNEPGVAGQDAADAVFLVQPPPPAAVAQGLLRRILPIVKA